MRIALDVDGVLLNYRLAYAGRWERAFGVFPAIKDPTAYKLWEHLDIEFLDEERLNHFESFNDSAFWTTMPVIESALHTCHALADAGHELIAVTACPAEFSLERAENLKGFPINDIYCVGTPESRGRNHVVSPKAEILNALMPDAFVDDYIDYFAGVDRSIKRVLINKPVNFISGLVRMDEVDHVVDDLSGALGVLLKGA